MHTRNPQGPRYLHPTQEQATQLEHKLRRRTPETARLYGETTAWTFPNPETHNGKVFAPTIGWIDYTTLAPNTGDPTGCDLATISTDFNDAWIITFHMSKQQLANLNLIYYHPHTPPPQNNAPKGKQWISADEYLKLVLEEEMRELIRTSEHARKTSNPTWEGISETLKTLS